MSGDLRFVGEQRELFAKHLFLVEIGNGDISAGFQKCSELSVEAAKIEYWEGGSTIPWKLPGRLTFSDITLERGASTSTRFVEWANQVNNASSGYIGTRGAGLVVPFYMRHIDIVQLDRDASSRIATWRLFNGWPQKFVAASDYDNSADDTVIESLTITFDYFKRVK